MGEMVRICHFLLSQVTSSGSVLHRLTKHLRIRGVAEGPARGGLTGLKPWQALCVRRGALRSCSVTAEQVGGAALQRYEGFQICCSRMAVRTTALCPPEKPNRVPISSGTMKEGEHPDDMR